MHPIRRTAPVVNLAALTGKIGEEAARILKQAERRRESRARELSMPESRFHDMRASYASAEKDVRLLGKLRARAWCSGERAAVEELDRIIALYHWENEWLAEERGMPAPRDTQSNAYRCYAIIRSRCSLPELLNLHYGLTARTIASTKYEICANERGFLLDYWAAHSPRSPCTFAGFCGIRLPFNPDAAHCYYPL